MNMNTPVTGYRLTELRVSTDPHRESIAAVVVYDGPYASTGFTVTHHLDRDEYRQVHHSTTSGGYLGTMTDPDRYGPVLDEAWIRAYLDARAIDLDGTATTQPRR